ncbi:helix-turn-helix domain-containing protein [Paenibacillus sp. HB172176]|uniref:helix-turn-helix domain-containing protein n=1 Tax=Paenibacillus sp. HB172176 TaxID=2493690 RepID=UPI00143B1606|nr:helix-turn-helix domain-containing protein [Paenibacillus sp. HB172176]
MMHWKRGRREGETFRRSVFVKLMLSFMCILFIPVIIGSLLYNKMEQAMIENANESNQTLLQKARLTLDNRMYEIDQLASQITLDPTLQILMYGESDHENLDEYKYIEFIKGFKRYRNLSPFIDDYYIYLKEPDRILTRTIKTDSDMFFNHIELYQNRTSKEMVDLLSTYHMKTFLPSEPVQYGLKQRNMISVVTSLPMGDATDVKGSFVVLIDESEILNLLREADQRAANYFILNDQNQLISSTEPDNGFTASIASKLNGAVGNFSMRTEDGEMMISYRKSMQNNWTYISVLPKDVLMAKVNEVKSLALLLVFICFAVGMSLAYYFAYKNHRPIREIIHAIKKGKNLGGVRIRNEFDFIRDELMTSIDEEKTMRGLLSQQSAVIQSDFIGRMMKGYVDTRSLTEQDFEFMNVRFKHAHFGVILLQIEDCRRFMKGESEREWTLMRFILINLSKELLDDYGYAIEMDRDRVGILLNYPLSKTGAGNELHQRLQQLQTQVEQKFLSSITIAVSSLSEGMNGIAGAYAEAVMALEYKLLPDQSVIIYYEAIKNTEHHYYYYPIETETQLMNYAKSGDYQQASKVLDQVFQANFQTRAISPEMGKSLFMELMSTVMKLFNVFHLDEKQFLDGELDPVKWMTKIGNAEKMLEKLKSMYEIICRKAEENRTDHGDAQFLKIQAYIEEHFASNELSLTSIAEYCGLNPSYLSTFYKKHSGQNLTEVITGLRIKQAKAYLAEGALTISQIAQQVGFTNDTGLIRVFKKTEGITPGKYREMVEPQSS